MRLVSKPLTAEIILDAQKALTSGSLAYTPIRDPQKVIDLMTGTSTVHDLTAALQSLQALAETGSGHRHLLRDAVSHAKLATTTIQNYRITTSASAISKALENLNDYDDIISDDESAETVVAIWSTVDELASTNASGETPLAQEWQAFAVFMREISDALHKEDGTLDPKAYTVGGVTIVTLLPGPWMYLGWLLLISLFVRDVRRAKIRLNRKSDTSS